MEEVEDMKYQRILYILSVFVFMGVGIAGVKAVSADDGVGSFEAFKSTDDPSYHQRHNGNIEWHLFHDAPKSEKPNYTDIYWIEGDKSWQKRIMDVKDTSGHHYLIPADVEESKYHSPCPLCEDPTYFWFNTADLDSDTEVHITLDFPGWSKEDGLCRNCFECYQLRAGKFYEGNAASTTDEYVIGYMKSSAIQDYFSNVK